MLHNERTLYKDILLLSLLLLLLLLLLLGLSCCCLIVRADLTEKTGKLTEMDGRNNISPPGKRYVIDYFAVIDFAIYNRCAKR